TAAQTVSGTVRFPAPAVKLTGLPATLPAGKPVQVGVQVTNPTGSPQSFLLDPRLTGTSAVTLAGTDSCAGKTVAAKSLEGVACSVIVPPHTTGLDATAQASVPVTAELDARMWRTMLVPSKDGSFKAIELPISPLLSDQSYVSTPPYGRNAEVQANA